MSERSPTHRRPQRRAPESDDHTRAYRLAAPAGAAAFEVDLPANTAYKRERLPDLFGEVPEHVSLVPVDFQTDDLAAALERAGLHFDRPTLFVWEAVTQYLTEGGFRSTLDALSRAVAGSRLIFTYIRADFLDGTNFYGAEAIYCDMKHKYDVWHFGVAPEAVAALLREYGWAEREQVGSREYTARYVEPSRPRPVGLRDRAVRRGREALSGR